MCKYCEDNPIKFDFDNHHHKMRQRIGSSWKGPILYSELVTTLPHLGLLTIESSFDINYCPICGKKLREDNV
jgi:hypothetical protein